MLVKLDKKALISLVSGQQPNYSLFEIPTVKKCGRYSGSYDEWVWHNYILEELSEQELYELYVLCRNSFEK